MADLVKPSVSGLFDRSVREDPHPGYHRAHADTPVGYDSTRDEWFALSWAACETALRGDGWSADRTNWRPSRDDASSRARLAQAERLRRFIVFLDPPEHTRLRALVSKAFTPRVVRQMTAWIETRLLSLADDLEAAGAGGNSVDLVEFASRLPIEVICRLLALPAADLDEINAWSRDAVRVFDAAELTAPELAAVVDSTRKLNSYLRGLIADRRAHLGSDLLSQLIEAEDQGDRLTELELQSLASFLFVAGHETTASLTANTVHGLLADRTQWELLAADPQGLAGPAVEEGLRWDGPLHHVERIALGQQELDGVTVPAGAHLNVVVAAANRDPSRFEDPDRFDIRRPRTGNLGFGFGPHYCIGAALGRAEAATTLRTLATRWPGMALAIEPSAIEHRPHLAFRGLNRLPVVLAQ